MQNTHENNGSEGSTNHSKYKKYFYSLIIFFCLGSQAVLFQNCGQMEVKGLTSGSQGQPDPDPASCNLPWGGAIADGQTVQAYQSATVPHGQTCAVQTRVCNDGVLSGSYAFLNCQASQPPNPDPDPTPVACTLPWGGTIPSGQSVQAYQAGTVPHGQTCVVQTRSCTNGSLSGSYTFQSCQASQPPQPDPVTTASLTVHNYSSGDGPNNLVSNGIPFKPGALTNIRNFRVLDGTVEVPVATKILARWPNNSIRVVLLQFESTGTATKTYTLSIGASRTTTDRTLTGVTFRYPRRIATLSGDYLSKSLVMWEQKPVGQSGYPAWEDKQSDRFSAINTQPNSNTACSRDDHYYDAANSSYQFYARSGQLNHLTNGRRWAYHHGRDQVHLTGSNTGFPRCPGNYLTNTRYTFVDSLVRDYFFWGDEESLRVAKLVVDNFYVPHETRWYYQAPGTRRFWTEREAAFAQLGLIAFYEATGIQTYLDLAKERFHSLYRMQQDNNNGAWVHNLYDHDPDEGCPTNAYGSSSFMSGLLAESLIRYHKLTKDPVARQSILYAADYLRTNNVSTDGNGFVYLGCRTRYNDPEPDIDLLIVHLYGYAYRLSNYQNQNYLNLGQRALNYSVANGYAGGHKQYNQHFRSSGHFSAYIDPSVESY